MASDVTRGMPYARENVTFFVEEMLVYVLRRKGIELELRRPEHLERLRAVALFCFTPSIGDAIVFIDRHQRNRVLSESLLVWNYIRRLQRRGRGEALHSSLVVLAMRILQERQNNVFLLMAIVAELCKCFCRFNEPALIGNAISALEFTFNRTVRGGFARTVIRITSAALRMRILYPTISSG